MGRSGRIWMLLGLALVAVGPLFAQTTKTFQSNVSEVFVDLVVTDSHGKLIKNLAPAQLEILDDGQPQKIDSFRLVARSANISTVELERLGVPGALRPQPFNIVVLVLGRVDGIGRKLARSSADWYIEHELGPADYAAVYRVDNALFALTPFTQDKARLERAVALAVGKTAQARRENSVTAEQDAYRMMGLQQQAFSAAQRAEMPPTGEFLILKRVLEEVASMAEEQASSSDLWALRNLAGALGQLRGRKEVLFFSQSLQVNANTVFVMRNLIADANRAHVSCYVVDPSGLDIASTVAEKNAALFQQLGAYNVAAQTGSSVPQQVFGTLGEGAENVSYSGRLTNLNELAEATGGFLAARTNDLNGFMAEIGDEVASHYELTYRPAAGAPGAYHTITAKVLGHPHWIVRARKGYYALPDLARPARGNESQLLAELGIQPEPRQLAAAGGAFVYFEGDLPAVRLETRVPLRDLAAPAPPAAEVALHPELRGKDLVRFTVLQVVEDARGRILENHSQPYGFAVPTAGLDRFRQSSAPPFVRTVHLPAGQYTVRTVVYQPSPAAATVLTEPLTIPAAGPVRLSSVVIAEGVAKVKDRAGGYDPLAYQGMEIVPNLSGRVDAREGTQQRLGFYFIAYVAPGTAGATVRLSFAQNGAVVATTPPTPLPKPDAAGRIPFLANVPLRIFRPGEYQVTVTVRAARASETATSAFTIVTPN